MVLGVGNCVVDERCVRGKKISMYVCRGGFIGQSVGLFAAVE